MGWADGRVVEIGVGLELCDVCRWGLEGWWGLGVFVVAWCLFDVGLVPCFVCIGRGAVVF